MRTATVILLALCFSSFIITGLGQVLTVNDNAAANGLNYDLIVTNSADATKKGTINNGAKTFTAASTNTYTAVWAKGLPLVSTYEYAATATASATDAALEFITINLSVGGQLIALTAATGTTTDTPNKVASGTAFTASTDCGTYSVNGVSGVVSFVLDDTCTVTITQIPGVTGVIQYNENTPTATQLNAVATAIAKAANMADGVTTAVATVTGTASGSTLVYYAVTGITAAQLDDVQEELQDAIYAKTITVDGLTQLNGFSKDVATSATGTTAAPSASTSANILAAYPKAHSRMIAVVGVFTTVLAAFFGLAL